MEYCWGSNKTFAVFFCWFFNKIFLLGYICFTNTNIYLGNKYHKYCWCMEPFLSIIKVLLVYDPNILFSFAPG